ncbi:hypothetical protein EI990_03690 [Streptococcus suis]|nr:hypothetical protein EI988_03435 [Streptococcus suis]RRR38910.1 hypothetical protein EI984_02915 [Streptococcus suis]RRR54143.1 hypothetical protein EI990_03690 [Streptococcus suis]RRR60121.1 hypothetical protein EI986_02545 [Streptococcus suis]
MALQRKREWERTRQILKEFVNKSLFPVVELKQSIPRLFHSHPPAQLKLSGRQFEVGDEANSVRISRRGQIWSV